MLFSLIESLIVSNSGWNKLNVAFAVQLFSSIAYIKWWVDAKSVLKCAEKMWNSSYGKYLRDLIK